MTECLGSFRLLPFFEDFSFEANVNYRDQATGRVPLTYAGILRLLAIGHYDFKCSDYSEACEYGWKVKTGVIEVLYFTNFLQLVEKELFRFIQI